MQFRFLCVLLTFCLVSQAAISPAELEAHVSFLASDALEGRDTPSKGLDIAAEYIAAQMRRGGLKPAGTDGFFQTARLLNLQSNKEGLALAAQAGGKTWNVDAAKVRLGIGPAVDLKDADCFHASFGEALDWAARLEPVLLLDVPGNLTRKDCEIS